MGADQMDELFQDKNLVKSNWFKFGKEGDHFKGTLANRRKQISNLPGKEGEETTVYEFKMHYGEFHNLDENKMPIAEATTLNEGEFWTVQGKPAIDTQMQNIKVGMVVGMRFTEKRPNKKKGFSPTHVIKVFCNNKYDTTFQGETGEDVEV